MAVLNDLMRALPFHLIPPSNGGQEYRRGDIGKKRAPASSIAGTRRRILREVIESDSAGMLGRAPRILLTRVEIMGRIRRRYAHDEIIAFQALAERGSASCALYVEWG